MKKIWIAFSSLVAVVLLIWYYMYSQITISVIIPVYNAEKYLERCLNSILSQAGTFEVIAVNDGSTDKSLEILEQYATKHKNLKIITQENQGIAAARNAGISVAKNKYLTFVDNDDWIEPDTFSKAVKVIKKDKPDILLTSYYDVYDKEWVRQTRGEQAASQVPEESKFVNHSLDKLELFSPFYAKEAYSDLFYETGGVRARFYLREFIEKHSINFANSVGEDISFIFRSYLSNPLISVMNIPVYNYRNRVDSVSKGNHFVSQGMAAVKKFEQTIEYKKADHRTQMLVKDSWLAIILIGLANLQRNHVFSADSLDKAYEAYKSFSHYNSEELKSCRNFQRLKTIFRQANFNQPL